MKAVEDQDARTLMSMCCTTRATRSTILVNGWWEGVVEGGLGIRRHEDATRVDGTTGHGATLVYLSQYRTRHVSARSSSYVRILRSTASCENEAVKRRRCYSMFIMPRCVCVVKDGGLLVALVTSRAISPSCSPFPHAFRVRNCVWARNWQEFIVM